MTKIIEELATGSIELGVIMTLILMIAVGVVTWLISDIWWVAGIAVLVCLHLCRVAGRVCVGIERDKTNRIRGTSWSD